jgi:Peptidase family S64
MRLGIRLLIILVFTLLLSSPKIIIKGSADGGANHQGPNTHFGVSGGNVNDITKRFCCSGTLGALVKDGNNNSYILSNNHVLGLSGKANPGDDISQPGRIDNNCQLPPIVADFTLAPQLGSSNVDAAIAQLRTGAMDSSGFIEDIGIPSSTVRNPTVGLSVAKSGRTTGFTTGMIGSVNTSVNVQYQASCGQGKKFVVSYTNQVVINSSSFSAGGDSGSLIVTNDANHQPVALLFAGSSTTTIGNPIGEVLTKVGTALGRAISFGGSAQGPSIESLVDNGLLLQEVESANEVKKRHEQDLMSRPGVIGLGVGRADDNPSAPALVIYIDRGAGRVPELPARVENVKVRFVLTDQFVAY